MYNIHSLKAAPNYSAPSAINGFKVMSQSVSRKEKANFRNLLSS